MSDSIIMLETRTGSPDGIHIFEYRVGEEYPRPGTPMSADLAIVFLREGWAAHPAELQPIIERGERIAAHLPAETMVDGPDEPDLCGVMTARGEPCRMRRPCRWHEE